jgi:hypothetical protein
MCARARICPVLARGKEHQLCVVASPPPPKQNAHYHDVFLFICLYATGGWCIFLFFIFYFLFFIFICFFILFFFFLSFFFLFHQLEPRLPACLPLRVGLVNKKHYQCMYVHTRFIHIRKSGASFPYAVRTGSLWISYSPRFHAAKNLHAYHMHVHIHIYIYIHMYIRT